MLSQTPMPTGIPAHDFAHLAGEALKRGLLICAVAPMLLFIAAHVLRSTGLGIAEADRAPNEQLLFYGLLVIGVADLAAAFVLRRVLFAPNRLRTVVNDSAAFRRQTLTAATILFALGASPMVYGVVLYLLGGDLRQLAAFAILDLVAFRLLRPSPDFLRNAAGRAVQP
jgi:hypothetical protein